MLFNSIDFAIFLPVVFILYWFVAKRNLEAQNLLLVIASYVFYGWWDWKFLSLIIISTVADYLVGQRLGPEKNPFKRKLLVVVSIAVNLGLLGFFKYYNFFIENLVTAFTFLGSEINPGTLNIILPVGISFYTFQTMSYTLDIYNRKIEPTRDFVAFSAFVSFFPQLVAGPIERASHLLPQFKNQRAFDYTKAVDGMRQILWGLFKKVVIADNCAEIANHVFNHSSELNGSALVLGAIFFAFQIYGDFSGYSDIAIGTARLFGFDLMQNFNFPYFSRNIAEFWRKWHISLSTWFRDYLYIPFGGSRGSTGMKIRNTLIIFIVSGFWHGANWTFIVWGGLHALYFLPLLLTNTHRKEFDNAESRFRRLKETLSIISTFGLVTFAWIFFRAENINHAFEYISVIFSDSLFMVPDLGRWKDVTSTIILLSIFLVIEWTGKNDQYAIASLGLKWHRFPRYLMYYSILLSVLFLSGSKQDFIYFQF